MGEIASPSSKDTVRAFVLESLLNGRQIADDENLLLSGLLDSLGVMSLVAFLEQEYGFKVPFDDVIIENFMTIDAVDAYVASRRG